MMKSILINPNRLRSQRGVSLIELLIAVLLTGIVTSAAFQFYASMHIESEAQFDKSEIQHVCRVSLAELKKTLR
ncbi:MAG: prepilin-type N-terminal cleavage/methylation domain-containing protein, partial [candidate division Zixibacteria bacterium]|nr:prepilin-type N-terminal cleavage/methylation domain-containing protein [candidate division Zixibacteria bacterium]